MCVGTLSMFALMVLSLLGWGAYEVGKKIWENRSAVARRAVAVFNFPDNAYQSIKARQTNT